MFRYGTAVMVVLRLPALTCSRTCAAAGNNIHTRIFFCARIVFRLIHHTSSLLYILDASLSLAVCWWYVGRRCVDCWHSGPACWLAVCVAYLHIDSTPLPCDPGVVDFWNAWLCCCCNTVTISFMRMPATGILRVHTAVSSDGVLVGHCSPPHPA